MHLHLQVEKIDFDGSAVVFSDFRRKSQKKCIKQMRFDRKGFLHGVFRDARRHRTDKKAEKSCGLGLDHSYAERPGAHFDNGP